jgi:hypothetical protein
MRETLSFCEWFGTGKPASEGNGMKQHEGTRRIAVLGVVVLALVATLGAQTRRRRRRGPRSAAIARASILAANTASSVRTTICSTTTSTSRSIPTRSPADPEKNPRYVAGCPARTRSGFACSKTRPHSARPLRQSVSRSHPLWQDRIEVRARTDTVWVDFRRPCARARTSPSTFYYSGKPTQQGRFGGFVFQKDPATGRDWIFTRARAKDSSLWWPSKDQWRDEVENMDISIALPNRLVDAQTASSWARKTWRRLHAVELARAAIR